LAGHSSGGGLAIRFLAGAHGDRVTSAILLAPFLKYNAPTMRPNAGGWSRPLVRRFIGLSLLNAVGVTVLNHLTVLQFAFPEFVLNTAHKVALTRAYTYRMNLSHEPRSDYLSDIAALPRFDLIVGQDDKFFIADAFKPLMRAVTDKGQYHMIQNRGHLNLLYAPETLQIIKRHLATG
jgi:pimeloyl-ACP methyl ester carboxylesterase